MVVSGGVFLSGGGGEKNHNRRTGVLMLCGSQKNTHKYIDRVSFLLLLHVLLFY